MSAAIHTSGPVLRARSETLAAALPPLLVEAERLAATVILGEHGRRRAGMGETFWQYRRAEAGDSFTAIDWRRSARNDRLYIRQTEWEAAQTVSFWVDRSRAMSYRSGGVEVTKGARASLLALALAVLLNRAGERMGLIGTEAERPRRGSRQVETIAGELVKDDAADFGAPPVTALPTGSRAVFFSDFLGPRDAMIRQLGQAADQGVRGVIVQVLDPAEETFPFHGRTVFQSMGGTVEYETDRAGSLREAYQAKLAKRRAEIDDIARRTGWLALHHRTDHAPRAALIWLIGALEGFVR